MPFQIFRTVGEMRVAVHGWREKGLRVGLVPTMGSLHEGHLTLVEAALKNCDRVIATIFVNPTQFGPNEDLDSYPRTEKEDCAKLEKTGGHAAFIPSVSQMYPKGFSTRVIVDGLTQVLCGASRPGHFDGVAQIVTKLLNQAQADEAFFGQKDWQQLTIIKRLACDLDINTQVTGVPTVRDEYGLALSSRNAYLSDDQLQVARKFNVILKKAVYDIASGGIASEICQGATEKLFEAGFDKVDYVDCRHAETLESIERIRGEPARIFGAVHIGRTRLIDNHQVS